MEGGSQGKDRAQAFFRKKRGMLAFQVVVLSLAALLLSEFLFRLKAERRDRTGSAKGGFVPSRIDRGEKPFLSRSFHARV